MSDPQAPAAAPDGGSQLESLRGLAAAATQQVLGATIAVTDAQWRAPSRLPGWSRAHVATHLARQADALVRLTEWARTGRRQEMYASHEERDHDIQHGSTRTGLELQIDLDTSAGRLTHAFDAVDEADAWDVVIEFRGGLRTKARLLPLARLLEVSLHHVDLDIGYEVGDIDAQTAEWLLEWCSIRLRERDEFPKLQLRADSGFTLTVGSSGMARVVTGSSAQLLGWLTSRLPPSSVNGAERLQLPAF
jgi:maleylpyruvate isomerase